VFTIITMKICPSVQESTISHFRVSSVSRVDKVRPSRVGRVRDRVRDRVRVREPSE